MNNKQWMASDEDIERDRNSERRPTRQGVWDMKSIRMRLVKMGVVAGLGFMGLWATPFALAEGAAPTPVVVEETPAADPGTDSTASFAFPTLYVLSLIHI